MEEIKPILSKGNVEILSRAVDSVVLYHILMKRTPILEAYTKPSDSLEFLTANRISVYVTIDTPIEEDNMVYKYVVVLSERTGTFHLVEDPFLN